MFTFNSRKCKIKRKSIESEAIRISKGTRRLFHENIFNFKFSFLLEILWKVDSSFRLLDDFQLFSTSNNFSRLWLCFANISRKDPDWHCICTNKNILMIFLRNWSSENWSSSSVSKYRQHASKLAQSDVDERLNILEAMMVNLNMKTIDKKQNFHLLKFPQPNEKVRKLI